MNANSVSIWALLRLEEGASKAEIRRAYSKQLKITRPDEDPEGFQTLREAYERALAWSEKQTLHTERGEAAIAEPEPEPSELTEQVENRPKTEPEQSRLIRPVAGPEIAARRRQLSALLDRLERGDPLVDILRDDALVDLNLRDEFEWACAVRCASPQTPPALRIAMLDVFQWERDDRFLRHRDANLARAAIDRALADRLFSSFAVHMAAVVRAPLPEASTAQRRLLNSTFRRELADFINRLGREPQHLVKCYFDPTNLNFWAEQLHRRELYPKYTATAIYTGLWFFLTCASLLQYFVPAVYDESLMSAGAVFAAALGSLAGFAMGGFIILLTVPVRWLSRWHMFRKRPTFVFGWMPVWMVASELAALALHGNYSVGVLLSLIVLAIGSVWAQLAVPASLNPFGRSLGVLLTMVSGVAMLFPSDTDPAARLWILLQAPFITSAFTLRSHIGHYLRATAVRWWSGALLWFLLAAGMLAAKYFLGTVTPEWLVMCMVMPMLASGLALTTGVPRALPTTLGLVALSILCVAAFNLKSYLAVLFWGTFFALAIAVEALHTVRHGVRTFPLPDLYRLIAFRSFRQYGLLADLRFITVILFVFLAPLFFLIDPSGKQFFATSQQRDLTPTATGLRFNETNALPPTLVQQGSSLTMAERACVVQAATDTRPVDIGYSRYGMTPSAARLWRDSIYCRIQVQSKKITRPVTGHPRTLLEIGFGNDGSIKYVTVLRSSGDADWDNKAVDFIKMIDKFPAPTVGQMPLAIQIVVGAP